MDSFLSFQVDSASVEPLLLAVEHLASYMSMAEVADSLIALAALQPETSQAIKDKDMKDMKSGGKNR